MQHPEEGLIHAWLDGALPASEAAELEAHVASCDECQARVAEARGLIAASSRIVGHLDVVPGGVLPKATRTKSWLRSPWPAAIAATLAIGIGLRSMNKNVPTAANQVFQVPAPAASQKDSNRVVVGILPDTVRPKAPSPSVTNKPAGGRPSALSLLPPPNAAVEKARIADAQPTAAPQPAPAKRASEPRLGNGLQLGEVVVTSADPGRSRAAAPASMSAGGFAGATPQSKVAAERRGEAVNDTISFVGCYEAVGPGTSAPQPSVIPRSGSEPARVVPHGYAAEERFNRFALLAEAAPTLGQLLVRTLDPAGRPYQAIFGAGWTIQGGRAIVRDSNGQTVVILTKSDSGVVSASVRPISCRR